MLLKFAFDTPRLFFVIEPISHRRLIFLGHFAFLFPFNWLVYTCLLIFLGFSFFCSSILFLMSVGSASADRLKLARARALPRRLLSVHLFPLSRNFFLLFRWRFLFLFEISVQRVAANRLLILLLNWVRRFQNIQSIHIPRTPRPMQHLSRICQTRHRFHIAILPIISQFILILLNLEWLQRIEAGSEQLVWRFSSFFVRTSNLQTLLVLLLRALYQII